MPYATPQELADYLGQADPPDNAERLLSSASLMVDALLRAVVYDTTDTTVQNKLRDATLAQAAHMVDGTADDAGEAAQWATVKIGNVSLGRASGDVVQTGVAVAGTSIASDTVLILQTFGPPTVNRKG